MKKKDQKLQLQNWRAISNKISTPTDIAKLIKVCINNGRVHGFKIDKEKLQAQFDKQVEAARLQVPEFFTKQIPPAEDLIKKGLEDLDDFPELAAIITYPKTKLKAQPKLSAKIVPDNIIVHNEWTEIANKIAAGDIPFMQSLQKESRKKGLLDLSEIEKIPDMARLYKQNVADYLKISVSTAETKMLKMTSKREVRPPKRPYVLGKYFKQYVKTAYRSEPIVMLPGFET